MKRTALKIVSVVVTGVLALAGCSVSSPQVAAYVGDAQIAMTQVRAVAQAIADASGDAAGPASGFESAVMTIMVQSKLAAKAAEAQSIAITDAQRESFYSQNEVYGPLAKNPASADFMRGFADLSVVVSTEAGVEAFREVLATTPVRINPRFGEWDPEQAALVEGSSGSLSELAPSK